MEPTVPSLHHDGDKEPKKVFPGGPDQHQADHLWEGFSFGNILDKTFFVRILEEYFC